MRDSMLTIGQLEKQFESDGEAVSVIDGVDLTVGSDEWLTLLGPSGCGKTTTLRCVAGLETPTSGSIAIDGVQVYGDWDRTNVPAHKRPVGMVFQSYAIWPHMTVYQNVEFPLSLGRGRVGRRKGRAEEVMKALEMVGLAGLADRPATKLSGGQQQRVALVRALVKGAPLLLLDEPLSNLDAQLRVEMREELRALRSEFKVSAMYVTHDQEEALTVSDRIAVMRHGRIVEIGSALDLYLRPKESYTARLVGDAETWACSAVSWHSDRVVAQTVVGPLECHGSYEPRDDSYEVMIRPEQIQMAQAGTWTDTQNVVEAVVEDTVFSGRRVAYSLLAAGQRVKVDETATCTVRPGDRVQLRLPANDCVLVRSGGEGPVDRGAAAALDATDVAEIAAESGSLTA